MKTFFKTFFLTKPIYRIFRNSRNKQEAFEEIPYTFPAYIGKYRPKSGDVIFDCGAYIGATTLNFSNLVGSSGKVYAFEPDDSNYKMLLKTIKKYKLSNVVPVKKGISSNSGLASFSNIGMSPSKILDSPKEELIWATSSIETLSLADAYNQFKLTRLDLVKMDIEGEEVKVIQGAKDFLKDHKVNFAIAAYHQIEGHQSYLDLEKLFEEIGYQTEVGNPKHLTLWANAK